MAFDLDDEELKATRKLLGIDKEIKKEDKEHLIKVLTEYKDYIFEFDDDNIKIEHILDYIRELKFQNTALKAEHNHNIDKIKELEEQVKYDINHIFTLKTIELNFIPKQKIKDKIKELKDTLKHYNDYSKLNLLEKVNVELIDARMEIYKNYYKKARINNMPNLIGKKVMTFDGHIGIVIKHFKPTGRDMTVHIKQDDGKIWYCPDYNIIEVEDK